MTDFSHFTVSALILLLVPGPTNTLLLSSGMMAGFARSCLLIPCEMLGYGVSIILQALVLGGLIRDFPEIGVGLRLMGVAYLALLSVRMWRHGTRVAVTPNVGGRRVFVTTVFNPKAVVFTVGIVPYLAQGQVVPAMPYLELLMVLIAAAGTGWAAVGALVGQGTERVLSPRLVMRGGAVAMGGFALVWLRSLM